MAKYEVSLACQERQERLKEFVRLYNRSLPKSHNLPAERFSGNLSWTHREIKSKECTQKKKKARMIFLLEFLGNACKIKYVLFFNAFPKKVHTFFFRNLFSIPQFFSVIYTPKFSNKIKKKKVAYYCERKKKTRNR